MVWPGSFRPDFQGESFQPNWDRLLQPNFKSGSFRPDFRAESFWHDLFILGNKLGNQVRY